MNISGINYESIVDGNGVRVAIFISGCTHKCEGCHNPSTHSFDSGKPFTIELQQQIIEYIKRTPFIKGITLSGGDPMSSPKDVLSFINLIKIAIPDINIWVYTGFTYEQLLLNIDTCKILHEIDILVDGRFILALKDQTLTFRGSSNQRIIDIKKSLKVKAIILL